MFTIPRSTSAEEREAFRQILRILEGMQVLVLEDPASLPNVKEGQTAYLTADGVTCRYVRVNSKLICEKLTAPEASAVKRSLLQRVGDEKRQQEGGLAGARRVAKNEIENRPRPARVDNVDSTVLVINQEATILKQYEQGHPFRDTFVFKNFATRQDAEDDNELPVNERPTNVSFDPATPVHLEGTHFVEVTFTPQRQGTAIAEVYLE